jgi:RNA polymerase sigma-70 factor (ECF subfamily)
MELIPGSREARFEQLYREHADAVYRYAVRRELDAADDVVAEAFLAAWRRLDDIPAGMERAWLLGAARRTFANTRRGARRRQSLAERVTQATTPEELTEPVPESAADPSVHAALACLPARDQELLMLVAWDGLDPAGVAATMGCSRANVAVRLHRARKRFAKELARLESSEETTGAAAEEAGYA